MAAEMSHRKLRDRARNMFRDLYAGGALVRTDVDGEAVYMLKDLTDEIGVK